MIRHLLIFFSLFSSYAMATSSMYGRTVNAYLDNDEFEDKIVCGKIFGDEENIFSNYQCEINTNTASVKWQVINNNECADYYIGSEKKGQFYIQCGIWGIGKTYKYQYDMQLNNWFLIKETVEYLPMYGDDPKAIKNDEITNYQEQWSIDKQLLKVTYANQPLKLIKLVESKYHHKLFSEILAIAKANKIDISKLTPNTVIEYNNLAFYYQESGANAQAITILKNIIKNFPDRNVAYLNLADAYLAVNASTDAIFNYQKYVSLMKAANKQDKIPKRVWEYLNISSKN